MSENIEDILKIVQKYDMNRIYVRLNQSNHKENPIEFYINQDFGRLKDWILWKTKRRIIHKGQIIIALVKMPEKDKWLLTNILDVYKELNVINNVSCDAHDVINNLCGRLIIDFHRTPKEQWPLIPYKRFLNRINNFKILPKAYYK